MVCWNNVCKNVFSSLDIGDIVAVDGFVCKAAFYADGQLPTPLNNQKAPPREYIELAGAHRPWTVLWLWLTCDCRSEPVEAHRSRVEA